MPALDPPEGEAATMSHLTPLREFVPGEQGQIETLTVEPVVSAGYPTLYFLVGWWGSASDYVPTMQFFSNLGFRSRSFSWRGTGRSDGGSFWGRGYEADLLAVLRHFKDDPMVLIPHSGALDYLVHAVPLMGGLCRRIQAVIVIAPLARSGSMNALMTWLRPGDQTTLQRWLRFLGSNILGVSWFMRNELALRRVLLSDRVSSEVVHAVQKQIDRCPFGRYFLSLWRFIEVLQYPARRLADFGIPHAVLLRSEEDQNFTVQQQLETARAIGAEFINLPATCHQWFADPQSFRTTRETMLSWLAAKSIIPKTIGL